MKETKMTIMILYYKLTLQVSYHSLHYYIAIKILSLYFEIRPDKGWLLSRDQLFTRIFIII